MRRTIGAIAALSLVILLFSNAPRAVLAADVSKIESGSQSLNLTIEGELKTGDASRIISVIEKNKPEIPKARKLWLFVFLSSTGGNLKEAFRLGRYLRSQDAFTAVPAGAKCYSNVCNRMFSEGRATVEYRACIKSILQGGNSRAQCFSDKELLDVLRGVFFYSMGQTLGICARIYPSLKSNAIQAVESFEATYSYQKSRLDRRTVAAFEKNYPGQGKQARDENDRKASLTAASQAEAFSKVQCEQSLYGVQNLVRANDWEEIMAPASVFFREERARIPRCN